MVNLTLRNIPHTVLERVRLLARGERRSLNSELLVLLEEGLSGRDGTRARSEPGLPALRVRTHVWGALCGGWYGEIPGQASLEETYARRAPASSDIARNNDVVSDQEGDA